MVSKRKSAQLHLRFLCQSFFFMSTFFICFHFKVLPAGWERWSLPSTYHWWDHTWSAASSSGLPSTKETQAKWRESNKGVQEWWRDWTISPVRKAWESWYCLAWRREASGRSYQCV